MAETPFSGIRTFMKCPYDVAPNTNYTSPDVYIAGIPYDLGVSNRPGARFGPAGIRDASHMLCGEANPNFRLDPFEKLTVYDAGDVQTSVVAKDALKDIESFAAKLTKHGSQLISMGGDHTVSLPLLRNIKKKHKKVSLVHFDAHVDTWTHNHGEKYRHGTPFHFASKEKLIDPTSSVQIGIRAPTTNEIMDYTRKELGFHVITSEMVHEGKISDIVQGIKNRVGDNKVYLTFDIDCIDPSQAPGTGTPEIGGLFTWQILSILHRIADLNWVGMDIVEVAPAYDNAQITSLTAATIMWTYLSILAARKY